MVKKLDCQVRAAVRGASVSFSAHYDVGPRPGRQSEFWKSAGFRFSIPFLTFSLPLALSNHNGQFTQQNS